MIWKHKITAKNIRQCIVLTVGMYMNFWRHRKVSLAQRKQYRGLDTISYRMPRQVTKCRTYRKGDQSTSYPVCPHLTYVWKENTWRFVTGADRSLPGIGSRNGRAVYFLALRREIHLWKGKMAKKNELLYAINRNDMKRPISGSYMPWISGMARIWRSVKTCRRPSVAKGGGWWWYISQKEKEELMKIFKRLNTLFLVTIMIMTVLTLRRV